MQHAAPGWRCSTEHHSIAGNGTATGARRQGQSHQQPCGSAGGLAPCCVWPCGQLYYLCKVNSVHRSDGVSSSGACRPTLPRRPWPSQPQEKWDPGFSHALAERCQVPGKQTAAHPLSCPGNFEGLHPAERCREEPGARVPGGRGLGDAGCAVAEPYTLVCADCCRSRASGHYNHGAPSPLIWNLDTYLQFQVPMPCVGVSAHSSLVNHG